MTDSWIEFAKSYGLPAAMLVAIMWGGWSFFKPLIVRLVEANIKASDEMVKSQRQIEETLRKVVMLLENRRR